MQDLRTRISWGAAGVGQAVTTSDVSDNSLDLGAADKELGINKLILHVVCKTAFTGLDSGLIIHIIDGTGIDGNGEINAGERELCSTGTLAQAEFTSAGGHWQLAVPAKKLQRYLAARYEPVSEAGVSGTFIAWFDEQPESDVTS
jgi:hypothetical protein